MRLFLGLTTSMGLEGLRRLWDLVEGWDVFGGIWVGDAENADYDLFSTVGLVLQGTYRIQVGMMALDLQAYNLSTVARAAATLWELGEGRVRLGFHIGNPGRGSRGGRKDLLDTVRGWVELLRRMWRNEGFISSGEPFPLEGYQMGFGPYRIPITLVGMDPRILELAGEVSDGVIVTGPRGYLEEALSWVRMGLSRRRIGGEFSLGVWPPILWDETSNWGYVIRGLAETPQDILLRAGIREEALERVMSIYRRAGVEETSELVTDDVLDAYCFHGNIRRISRELRSLERLGVSEIVLEPIQGGNLLSRMVDAWGTE